MMQWPYQIQSKIPVTYPIIQAPMLGVTSPEMVAAVSNGGGLGSLPVGSLSAELTRQLIRKTRSLTSKPFAVNLFVNDPPIINNDVIETMQDHLESLAKKYGFEYQRQSRFSFTSYKEQISVLIEEKAAVVSFTFGMLDEQSIKELKENSVVLIGTATTLEEALALERVGMDFIVAQGIEAGGHRGSFLNINIEQQENTLILLSNLAKEVNTPLIAAGGIYDASGIKNAFETGASAVQLGSAFLCSNESLAIPSYKAAVQAAQEEHSIVTKVFSGRWARGLKNIFINELEGACIDIPDYPVQVSLTSGFRSAAIASNNKDFTALWAGKNACKAEFKSSREILLQLVKSFNNGSSY